MSRLKKSGKASMNMNEMATLGDDDPVVDTLERTHDAQPQGRALYGEGILRIGSIFLTLAFEQQPYTNFI
jgi:hypothetical protein